MLWLLAYPRRQTKKIIDLSEDYLFKMSFDPLKVLLFLLLRTCAKLDFQQ
ncbi:hypothetical protein T03_13853 [Trichinella britovi]|uniref:Uncharacterized protein n=1 Tax=Trichinella britovi TaxID=45882 RepID=A0A0V1C977_TRIBR|nr:hypothetical protein T03_13853 [Trichinella britovi]